MEQESIVLRTEGLVKRYGKRTVVNDVSFNVRQGEIVGLWCWQDDIVLYDHRSGVAQWRAYLFG